MNNDFRFSQKNAFPVCQQFPLIPPAILCSPLVVLGNSLRAQNSGCFFNLTLGWVLSTNSSFCSMSVQRKLRRTLPGWLQFLLLIMKPIAKFCWSCMSSSSFISIWSLAAFPNMYRRTSVENWKTKSRKRSFGWRKCIYGYTNPWKTSRLRCHVRNFKFHVCLSIHVSVCQCVVLCVFENKLKVL